MKRPTSPSRRLVAVLLVAVFAAGWWTLLRPAVFGGPLTFIIVNGASMEPGMHTGDLAVVFERDEYAEGDVIAFRHRNEDGTLGSHVIHRITGGDAENGFVLRGDNNTWDDPWEPTGDQVAGRMLFSVPDVGTAVFWLTQPIHLAALCAGATAMMIIAGGGPKPHRKEALV